MLNDSLNCRQQPDSTLLLTGPDNIVVKRIKDLEASDMLPGCHVLHGHGERTFVVMERTERRTDLRWDSSEGL